MRAARCLALGPLDDVVATTLDDPEPEAGQLGVRVAAATVNHPDVTFPLEETVAALRVVADRQVVGKVLVLPEASR